MITSMTKYSFILLKGEKDGFLDRLQELGVVDISRSQKPVDDVSGRIVADIDETRAMIKCITAGSDAHLVELQTDRLTLARKLDEVSVWGDYDREKLAELGARFYRVPKKQFDPQWEQQYALQTVAEKDGGVWFVIIGDNAGFPYKELPAPEKTEAEVRYDLERLDARISSYSSELEKRRAEIPSLEEKIHKLYADLSLYLAGITGKSAAEDSLLVFEGFAPSEDDDRLKAIFDDMDIYWEAEPARTADNPPIKLKNNWFVRQFEPLTAMYGMPVYDEFDPTVFLSIFFLLFFSICMGDMGYGLLLILIGLALKGKDGGLGKMWSLIVTLGAGTVAVGFVMGGLFGVSLPDQSWVPGWMKKCMITGDIQFGGNAYSKQMALSLVIGVVHICLAMITKAVWAVKRAGFKNSLGTLGWTLLIVGGVTGITFGAAGILPQTAMKLLLIGIAAISALGIFVFNRWGRNPLLNMGIGLWDTYSMASGLMSDVLSYVRLYALGLSGSMLGQTFNLLADMVKGTDPTWQWVPFVLILIIGHALNLAMSCLGAFVHPLRLNFVEFFKNSGYEGMGAAYNPLEK